MVILKHDPRREMTYGWYPPQQGVYEKFREKQRYEKECLFKYWDSLYHHNDKQNVFTPEPPEGHQGERSPARSRSAARSADSHSQGRRSKPPVMLSVAGRSMLQSAPSGRSRHPPQASPELAGNSDTGMVFQSFKAPKPSPKLLSRPSSKGYSFDPKVRLSSATGKSQGMQQYLDQIRCEAAENEMGSIPAPRLFAPSASNDDRDLQQVLQDLRISSPEKPGQSDSATNRSQSAPLVRETSAVFSRRINSAGGSSQSRSRSRAQGEVSTSRPCSRAASRAASRPTSASTHRLSTPPKTPPDLEEIAAAVEGALGTDLVALEEGGQLTMAAPGDYDELQEVIREDEARGPVAPTPPPYEKQQDQYGWYVEVHGDPLNIKKIAPRLPYTVRCEPPVVPEDPPLMKVQDNRTFFFNTIPKRPATFTVHPEWASEAFNQKKNAHIKATKKRYNTRKFGFVY